MFLLWDGKSNCAKGFSGTFEKHQPKSYILLQPYVRLCRSLIPRNNIFVTFQRALYFRFGVETEDSWEICLFDDQKTTSFKRLGFRETCRPLATMYIGRPRQSFKHNLFAGINLQSPNDNGSKHFVSNEFEKRNLISYKSSSLFLQPKPVSSST